MNYQRVISGSVLFLVCFWIGLFFLSSTGVSIEKMMELDFITSMIGTNLIPILLSILFIGLAIGFFSGATRGLHLYFSGGLAAILSILAIAPGIILFPNAQEFIFLSAGFLMAMLIAFVTPVALDIIKCPYCNKKFVRRKGIGKLIHDGSKKSRGVVSTFAIFAFIMTLLLVTMNLPLYQQNFKDAIGNSISGENGLGITKEQIKKMYSGQLLTEEEINANYESQIRTQISAANPGLDNETIEMLVQQNMASPDIQQMIQNSLAQQDDLIDNAYEQLQGQDVMSSVTDLLEKSPIFQLLMQGIGVLYAFTVFSLLNFANIFIGIIGGLSFALLSKVFPPKVDLEKDLSEKEEDSLKDMGEKLKE